MNIFIICTVRNATEEYKTILEKYSEYLESCGNTVYLPHRDTNQKASGIDICSQNRFFMERCEEVHIFYSGKSQGTHFDLGMAFAMDKTIKIIDNEKYGEGKSFPRMIDEWQDRLNRR
ncbi:MAG: hypothetical protein WC998_09430 [Candidatus Paceibacterota bacterium]|jgi:hypothetical protein